MSSDALAPWWIFWYFQVFGLHSFATRIFLAYFYQFLWIIFIIANYFYAIYAEILSINFELTTAFVDILEGKENQCFMKVFYEVNFILETIYSLASIMSVLCSINDYSKAIRLLNDFHKFDSMMVESLNMKLNYEKVESNSRLIFILLLLLPLFCNLIFLTNSFILNPQTIAYAVPIVFLIHLVHISTVQIIIFMNGVHFRLEIINVSCAHLSNNKFVKLRNVMKIQTALIMLHDIKRSIDKCFGLTLVFSLLQLYASILINVYWIGLALLDISGAFILGIKFLVAVLCKSKYNKLLLTECIGIIPSFAFIIYLAHIDLKVKMSYRRIVSTSTSGEYFHHSKELSILLWRCKFTMESFRAFDTSFASVGKVTKIRMKYF